MNNKIRSYKLVYKQESRLVSHKNMTEEDYFEYYQNGHDPTFEHYGLEFQSIITNNIDYYSTVFSILREGKKLSSLTWKDFRNFIYEWLTYKNHYSLSWIAIGRANEISFVLTKEIGNYGSLKYICLVRKYSLSRPIGLKVIRELDYLIYKNGASKGILITTSRLTKDSLIWISENKNRIFHIDAESIEQELKDLIEKTAVPPQSY